MDDVLDFLLNVIENDDPRQSDAILAITELARSHPEKMVTAIDPLVTVVKQSDSHDSSQASLAVESLSVFAKEVPEACIDAIPALMKGLTLWWGGDFPSRLAADALASLAQELQTRDEIATITPEIIRLIANDDPYSFYGGLEALNREPIRVLLDEEGVVKGAEAILTSSWWNEDFEKAQTILVSLALTDSGGSVDDLLFNKLHDGNGLAIAVLETLVSEYLESTRMHDDAVDIIQEFANCLDSPQYDPWVPAVALSNSIAEYLKFVG